MPDAGTNGAAGSPFTDGYLAPHQAHSETSRQAAVEIEPTRARKRLVYLRPLVAAGDRSLTDEEMAVLVAHAMPANGQRPRRIELVNHGCCRDSVLRRKPAGGWVATGIGRAALEDIERAAGVAS